jgi:hypothetical protein
MSFIINSTFQAPLSKSIQKEYNKLTQTISQIPQHNYASKEIQGTGGKVSVADIVAYQIGWGTLLFDWYQAGINSKNPQMPGDGFDSWDYSGLAQHFYKKYHALPKEQQKMFHLLVVNILSITELEFKNNNLDTLGVWDWCTLKSGKQWPLSKWIQVNTVTAALLIKKLL